ncbi:hypothetical protein [Endozoicomonas sp. 8E]|uniref:hypothetical protein n=1 Tax=Endozoicomonas sp. 8E TaxID=3035692 RepID=UPI00293916A7|nr:hypothetical protein [Endozoicomonas sp. 8E]WOG30074.1 hypothetical protein P6910_10585 [Endozoicomonas sp. 8E]
MIKLQRYIARLIVTLFLIQALSLNARTTQSPTTTSLPSTLCDNLTGQTAGVQQRLNQYNDLFRGRQCIVLSADPIEDTAELINRTPENTVILLSSNIIHGATSTPSVTPATTKKPVNYFIDSHIFIKGGMDIIGAADDGFEIVISLWPSFDQHYMVRMGYHFDFQFGETRDSHIKHVTFQPILPDNSSPIHTIIFAECTNRRLFVDNNVFYLPNWIGVRLDCREPLDAAANNLRPGPGLQFINNTVLADSINSNGDVHIPVYALYIFLPEIENQSRRVFVIENTFQGKMGDVGHFDLGPGSSMDIFRNSVDIDNYGMTLQQMHGTIVRKGGFILVGHSEPAKEPPLYNLAGNQIHVTGTAINVEALIELALACNQLRAFKLWRQTKREHRFKAADPLPLAGECEKPVNSTAAMATTRPPGLCQIVNTWTADINSTATALSGLSNVEGQFNFDPVVCVTVNASSVSITTPVTTSSVATNTITGLSVMTFLALLLNL